MHQAYLDAYLDASRYLDASSRLATIEMGKKLGRGAPALFWWGELGPHLAQCGVDQGPPLCQVPSWLIHPAVWPQWTWAENWAGGSPVPFSGRGELGPHLTQGRLGWVLPLYQVASWSIQPFGYNRYGPKIGGCAPFWGRGAASPSNIIWPGTRPACVPSLILICRTVWPQYTNVTDRQTGQRDRQIGQDRQWSDSIGQTVL